MRLRVAAVIPAHNEERTIQQALEDIIDQSYSVELIVVVNDRSTDDTAMVLEGLRSRIPHLVVVSNDQPKLRAGAINCGLDYLGDKPIDLVMVADADSRFDRGLIEQAVRIFERSAQLGGVCSTSGVVDLDRTKATVMRRMESWLLWRLQRLDGAGFDATRTATWSDVQILHGLCTVFSMQALKNIGGYSPGHLLEDYDLSIRLKKAGWKAMYSPEMRAWTRVPTTFRAFFRQRLRWMRGGADIILEHGVNRFTHEDFINHILFILLFLGVLTHVSIALFARGWHWRFTWHPIPLTLVGVSYIWSLYKLRFVDRLRFGDALLRIAILPELLVAVSLSLVQLWAYYLALFGRPQEW